MSEFCPRTKNNKHFYRTSSFSFVSLWNREQYEEANLSILKKKQHIDNLITEAYEKNVDEVTYVEAYLDDKNDKLNELSITKNTLLVDAFSEYLHGVKAKSKKLTEARSLERYFSELHRLERYKPKAKLGEIDIQWVEEFTEFLATPKEETIEVYDKRKGSTFTVTKTVSLTDTTIIRFLKDLKFFPGTLKNIQSYHYLLMIYKNTLRFYQVKSPLKIRSLH